MNKKEILHTLELARKNSRKRKFNQTVDIIFNLKSIDLKKNKVDGFVTFPKAIKERKIGAFVDASLKDKAKEFCSVVVLKEEFPNYKNKKLAKKLAKQADFFIAQVTLMPQVASIFGRFLGPKGKMPNPKIGAVIAPNADLKQVTNDLKKTFRIEAKVGNIVKTLVGKEDNSDEEIASNILLVNEALVSILPKGNENIRNVILKLSMGMPIRIGETEEEIKKRLEVKNNENKKERKSEKKETKEIKKDEKA